MIIWKWEHQHSINSRYSCCYHLFTFSHNSCVCYIVVIIKLLLFLCYIAIQNKIKRKEKKKRKTWHVGICIMILKNDTCTVVQENFLLIFATFTGTNINVVHAKEHLDYAVTAHEKKIC